MSAERLVQMANDIGHFFAAEPKRSDAIAGIAGHIHMHVLPRWVADANFVSVVCETRILPEALEETWKRMTAALKMEP